MKEVLKTLLFGLLSIISITIFEFLVTLPLGSPWDTNKSFEVSNDVYKHYLNIEFILTALPAGVVIFFILKLSKSSYVSSMKKGTLWTVMLCVNYVLIGIGNDNLTVIFSTFGIYVLFLCCLIGAFIYKILNKPYKK